MTITLATLQSEPTKANLDRIITYLNQPIWGRRFISGLVPSNDVDAGGDDLIFTAGVATDLSSDHIMELGTSMTKLMDTAWAEGTGQGALDTGAVSDTTYHVWLIKNRKSGKVDILSSLSASAPTMPTGYDRKRRIFSFRRASGANQLFSAVEINGGGLLVQVAPVIDFTKDWTGVDDAAQTGTSTVIPIGVQMLGHWTFAFNDASFAAVSALLATSFGVTDTAPINDATDPLNSFLGDIYINSGVNPGIASKQILTRASDAAIRYRGTSTTADHSFEAILHGWTDFRVA